MERNVTNLLTLGNRIHVVCEDYETGKIFMQDAYAEGFRWKDGSHPNSITYCLIHHNRLHSSYGSYGGAMACHHNQESYFVSYKLFKEGSQLREKLLLKSSSLTAESIFFLSLKLRKEALHGEI